MSVDVLLGELPVFEASTRAVLAKLRKRLGFQMWMMTRVVESDWEVLMIENHGYDLREGAVLRWSDSFCSRMMKGEGPRFAPDAQMISSYSEAPIGEQVPISSYLGVPVELSDGSFFGTLCAIDPDRQPEEKKTDVGLVETYATLLGSILFTESQAVKQTKLLEECRLERSTDSQTGLVNRMGWDLSISEAESRLARYRTPASILFIDLDNLKNINDSSGHAAGDIVIQQAAECLRETLRYSDVIARIGGDEFAVLLYECNANAARAVRSKITSAFAEAKIAASIGSATRAYGKSLQMTIQEADQSMYTDKTKRKQKPI